MEKQPAKHSQAVGQKPSFLCARNIILATIALGIASIFHLHHFESYAICSTLGIYTVDEHNPSVECMLVSGDRIEAVGTYTQIKKDKTWYTRIRYTPSGAIVVPGLTDAHAHVLEYGWKMQLQLDGAQSIAEVIERTESFVKAHPDVLNDKDRWIEGMGWDQTKWENKQFPTADALETPLLKGRPISLSRIDGHARWVSQRVLEIIKNTTGIPEDVDGGLIMRNDDGEPTGVFVDQAMEFIPTPPRTQQQRLEYFRLTMEHAVSVGLTNIHDAGVDVEDIKFFRNQAELGNLPIRIYLMAMLPPDFDNSSTSITPFDSYGKQSHLSLRSFKLFMDGALGSWGAALLEPYFDKPETKGLVMYTPERIQQVATRLWKEGWQVNVHCIGDRANHMILDVFEEILTSLTKDTEEVTKWRPRIEHAQILSEDDLERVRKLGVLSSVQPTHATSDMWYAEQRLGPERIKGAYAYKTLLEASPTHHLPLGSDFPVEGINPLLGFYAAVSRLSMDGTSPNSTFGWYPSQRLTRAEALRGMTLSPAYASFREHDLGSLQVGKKADYVVLDHNIMDEGRALSEILRTKVIVTAVDGKVVYGV